MAISTKIARIHQRFGKTKMTWQRGESWHTPNFGKNGEYAKNSSRVWPDIQTRPTTKIIILRILRKYQIWLKVIKKDWQKLEQDDKNGKKRFGENDKKQPDKTGISIVKNNLRLDNLAWIHQRSAKKIKSVNDFDKNVNLTWGIGQESQNDEFCEIGEFVANFWSKVWEDGLLITSGF